ncbi:MAG: retention module-containing protein, partial [Undibacterium sp.]|nr:retention module-containing protein [Undibacterium sp.]
MANSTNIVGKVVALQGQAIVKSPDGSQHQLKVGDVIYENDVIVTLADGRVELSFDSGHRYVVREHETVTLDSSVYAPAMADAMEAALLPSSNSSQISQQDVNKAVIGSDSLDKLLEETAAGLGGGDSSDAHGFVKLDRIAEAVSPLTFTATPIVAVSTTTPNTAEVLPLAPVEVSTVSSPTTVEGNNQDFVITLTHASATPTSLTLAVVGVTASLGVDTSSQLVSVDGGVSFVPLTSTVIVPPGVTSVIVRLATVNDGIIEGSETLSVVASTSANTSPIFGTGTIIDGAIPSLSITGVPVVNEAAGTVTYTVSLSAASAASVRVNFATADGTALAGSDFGATTGSLTFAPGETSKTITVNILNDSVFEGSESYSVNLNTAVNATISNGSFVTSIHDDGTGVGGIDNDTPVVLSVSSPSAGEGGNLDFQVSLSNASTSPTILNLIPRSGTATLNVDTTTALVSVDGGFSFAPLTASTTIPPGVTGVVVRIPTVIDGIVEGPETLTLSASTSATPSPVVGTGTIVDGAVPSIAIVGLPDVNEAIGSVTYTITLSTASVAPVSVNYATAAGTATSGVDFSAIAGTVTFAPGETTKTVSVPIINDTLYEGPENYRISLSVPVNATISTGTVTTTIHDDGTGIGGNDDDRPAVLSVSSPTVDEGNDLVFTVTMSKAGAVPFALNLTQSSGSATIGVDTTAPSLVSVDGGKTYVPLSSVVQVPAGVTSILVKMPTINDGILEGTENLTLGASTSTNSSPVVGVGTILDGAIPEITIVGLPDVNEAIGTVTY